MNAEQVNEYVGLMHRPGAKGPDEYDCWNLLCHLQATYFGCPMPEAPIGDEAACLALFSAQCRDGNWVHVDLPTHGDAACLRGGMHPHVGIYLDLDGGGVLHSMEGIGVIWTKLAHLKTIGFGRTTFYRVGQ